MTSAATSPPKQFTTVLGRRLAHVEIGQGGPIVLLHGNPTSSYLWRDVIGPLAGLGRVIVPDLIGHGDSDKLPESAGPGRYTLEVTSPGLERTLRTPQHFQREVGKTIAVRLLEARDGRRRLQGPLIRANDTTFVVCLDDTGTEETVRYSDVERARVVFVWGAEASPASGRSTSKKNKEVV